ncbi:hypothetical protein CLV78_12118 [Aliiruegeria haliotis]|uniref:Uncharacterized protein n=1 Tax=Aliiruegeria haliotis TaxID=1280846 RepID=A0A2T0REF9_9RHOB|nr:hypothetical protein [Aliiruegeria haliotis]PRY19529.1 hypothetical protein CLV78_12118 [Aliiruegeria haliotis]
MTTNAFLPDDLSAEMDRLGRRKYAEIGVPMYLVLEDLTGNPAEKGSHDGDTQLAVAFSEAISRVEAEKGDIEVADIARVIEVLADRTFLDRPFSELSDEESPET